jgi:hypothetical protein
MVVAKALRELHRDDWQTEPYMRLLGNEEVHHRILAGDDVANLLKFTEEHTTQFRQRRKQFLLYE